jgi:hypothetical protein
LTNTSVAWSSSTSSTCRLASGPGFGAVVATVDTFFAATTSSTPCACVLGGAIARACTARTVIALTWSRTSKHRVWLARHCFANKTHTPSPRTNVRVRNATCRRDRVDAKLLRRRLVTRFAQPRTTPVYARTHRPGRKQQPRSERVNTRRRATRHKLSRASRCDVFRRGTARHDNNDASSAEDIFFLEILENHEGRLKKHWSKPAI